MKLHILSDLHLEYAPFRPTERSPLAIDADAVILAGDIGSGAEGAKWAKERFANKPVIYVAGNHEFYGRVMSEVIQEIEDECDDSNVHFLNDSEVVIEGVRFLGATLWTDFDIEGAAWRDIAFMTAHKSIYDFRTIKSSPDSFFTPLQSLELHRKSVDWLNFKLSEPFAGETVVVTHHGCSAQSISEKFRGSLVNGAFVSNLEHLMGRCKVWVHGHTHSNLDYEYEDTRVIVNPRGYCRSNFVAGMPAGTAVVEQCENRDFDAQLVIAI